MVIYDFIGSAWIFKCAESIVPVSKGQALRHVLWHGRQSNSMWPTQWHLQVLADVASTRWLRLWSSDWLSNGYVEVTGNFLYVLLSLSILLCTGCTKWRSAVFCLFQLDAPFALSRFWNLWAYISKSLRITRIKIYQQIRHLPSSYSMCIWRRRFGWLRWIFTVQRTFRGDT